MIKLSNRLLSIVENVSPSDYIIDVGCDHAYLAIYLCDFYNLKRIYVSDINNNALQNGIRNIKLANLSAKIIPLLGNGISVINDNMINTLIISGLGAFSIIKIINHPNINQINKIIIQTNKDYYLIRKSIIKFGFYIHNETVVKDKNQYYTTIHFKRGKNKTSMFKIRYGFHNNVDFYQYECNRHKKILSNIKYKHFIKKIYQLINIIIYKTIIFRKSKTSNH